MNKINAGDFFFVFPLLVASLFIYQAISEKYRITQIEKNGVHVIGVVQKVKFKADTDKEWTDYEIKYYDSDGYKYTVSNHFSTNDMRYHMGDSVKIVYQKNNPQQAFIDSKVERNYPFLVSLGAGFACIITALFFRFYLGRKLFK